MMQIPNDIINDSNNLPIIVSFISTFISTLISALVSGLIVTFVNIKNNKELAKESEMLRSQNEQVILKLKYENQRELDKERNRHKSLESIESNSYEIVQKFYAIYVDLLILSKDKEAFDENDIAMQKQSLMFFTQFDLIFDMHSNSKITNMAFNYCNDSMSDMMKKTYYQQAFEFVQKIDHYTPELKKYIESMSSELDKTKLSH